MHRFVYIYDVFVSENLFFGAIMMNVSFGTGKIERKMLHSHPRM